MLKAWMPTLLALALLLVATDADWHPGGSKSAGKQEGDGSNKQTQQQEQQSEGLEAEVQIQVEPEIDEEQQRQAEADQMQEPEVNPRQQKEPEVNQRQQKQPEMNQRQQRQEADPRQQRPHEADPRQQRQPSTDPRQQTAHHHENQPQRNSKRQQQEQERRPEVKQEQEVHRREKAHRHGQPHPPPPPPPDRDGKRDPTRPQVVHRPKLPLALLPSEPNDFDNSETSFLFVLARRAKQCFFHRSAGDFQFEFRVTYGGRLDVSAFVLNPDGSLAYETHDKSYGQHTATVDRYLRQGAPSPVFTVCIDNRYSTWDEKVVDFNIRVRPDRSHRPSSEQLSDELKDHLQRVSLSWDEFLQTTDTVEQHLQETSQLQRAMRGNEARDRLAMESNVRRVQSWSLFQVFVMIGVGLLQVFMIRALFDEKSRLHRLWGARSRSRT